MKKLHKIDNQIYQNDQNSIFVPETFLQWNENRIQTNLELKIKHPNKYKSISYFFSIKISLLLVLAWAFFPKKITTTSNDSKSKFLKR